MFSRVIRSAPWVTLIGVVMLLLGLGWDAVLHRLDPDLAAREGIFNLSNPGHVLFAAGIAFSVAGTALFLVGLATAPPARRVMVVLPVAGLLGLAGVSSAFAVWSGSGLTGGHAHDHTVEQIHVHEDGTTHNHEEHEQFLRTTDTSGSSTRAGTEHSHGISDGGDQARHQHAPDIPISMADLNTLNGQLAVAREATEKYQDVRVALRDGYIQGTQDLPGIAAHFANLRNMADGVFDPAKPEILLYAKLDGRWTLVGLSYMSPFTDDETPPEGFAGPLDAWHYHTNLCFRGQSVVSAGGSAEACKAAGGRFHDNTGWMMHLWLYMESPEGLFAHQNSLLKGSGAILTRAEIAALP